MQSIRYVLKTAMMRTCLADGCTRNSFSHGYCQIHQYKRTDSKAIEPRSAIRPCKRTTSDKSELKTTKNELLFSFGFNNLTDLYKDVWNTRKHECIFTGENLDKVPQHLFLNMFMHILRKSGYSFWKFNPENIVLGFPEFHKVADDFTEEERIKHPEWRFDLFFQMQEEQKQKYRDFLMANML